jgi:hypothetical protein
MPDDAFDVFITMVKKNRGNMKNLMNIPYFFGKNSLSLHDINS